MIPSPFDPIQQENSLEAKITFALERISLVFKSLLQEESNQSQLSPIQLQILVFLLYHNMDQCKVSYLAIEFGLTKATVSDSVKALIKKKLVQKSTDPEDSRSFSLSLTAQGKKAAEAASQYSNRINSLLEKKDGQQKELFYSILLKTIRELQQQGLIPLQRMCFSCKHYKNEGELHYCNLLAKPLGNSEIRLDCKEHQLVIV